MATRFRKVHGTIRRRLLINVRVDPDVLPRHTPLAMDRVRSYFDDRSLFPEGSVRFDCALVMRNSPHAWEVTNDMDV